MVKILKNFIIVFLLLFVLSSNYAYAGIVTCGNTTGDECTMDDLFKGGTGSTTSNPFWVNLIQQALGISGIVILCIFIFAGVKMMISGGDPNKIKAARTMMINSFAGILIVFFAFTLVKGALMILVGNKWTIYFGDSEIKTTTTSNTVEPTDGTCTHTKCSLTVGNVCCKGGTDVDGTGSQDALSYFSECKVPANKDLCVNAKFAYSLSDNSKRLKDSSDGSFIDNGTPCHCDGGNCQGKCIYVKDNIIKSYYFKEAWNLSSDACGRYKKTNEAAKVSNNRCLVDLGVSVCLRCVESTVYDKIKE